MTPKQLLSCHGRMRRKHYLVVHIVMLVFLLLIGIVERSTQTNLSLVTLLIIAAFVPSVVRRLHDMGYSGWLAIGVILFPVVSILLLALPGVPGSNAYGADPKSQASS
jgi:uncharacterized membrane protein YhaH (DUF805 family)